MNEITSAIWHGKKEDSGSGSPARVVSKKILFFCFPFSQFLTIMISSNFLKNFVIYLVLFAEVLFHFRCFKP